jgi:hypothetical protein
MARSRPGTALLSRDQLQAQNPEHAREAEDVIPAHRAREL